MGENTGQCLQEMIYDNRSKRISPCTQLEEFAFDVHPICYKQYNICALDASDIYNILSVVRAIDYATRKSLSQLVNVGLACLQQYVSSEEKAAHNRFEASTALYNRDQREEMKSFFLEAPNHNNERRAYYKRALQLMISLDSNSTEAMDAYIELYGKTERSNDDDFFSCGQAMSIGKDVEQCNPELQKQLKGVKRENLKRLNPIISPEKMKLILKSLRNRYAKI